MTMQVGLEFEPFVAEATGEGPLVSVGPSVS